jgi:hypothetical protein
MTATSKWRRAFRSPARAAGDRGRDGLGEVHRAEPAGPGREARAAAAETLEVPEVREDPAAAERQGRRRSLLERREVRR